MKRKWLVGILAAIVAISMLIPIEAFAGTTTAKTPDTLGLTTTKWQKSFSTSTSGSGMNWNNVSTPPALIDGSIFVASYNKVYKLNKNTGAKVAESKTLGSAVGYAMIPIVGDGNGYIYVITAKCKVVKLKEWNLSIVWKSSTTFEGQNVCPLKYYDGKLYSGTWGDDNDAGTYFCIDSTSGKTVWSLKDTDGYYWAGAAKVNGRIVFGSESKKLYSVNASATGKSDMDTQILEMTGSVIRCTPAVDGNNIYVSTGGVGDVIGTDTGNGNLYKISVGSNGKMKQEGSYSIATSKNTPVVSGNYIFVGDDNNHITVLDKDTLAKVNQVTTPAPVKGEMLVSTGNAGKICVYATYNTRPGGIYYAEFSSDCSAVTAKGVTYVPSHSQYCIAPIIADESTGVLYYKNDSGYIMAVKAGLGKTKLTTAAGSKKIALKWSKVNGATGYYVYRATAKSGTYKKMKATTGLKWTNTGLKKNQKYYYKVKAYKTVSGTNIFGNWSNISYKIVK